MPPTRLAAIVAKLLVAVLAVAFLATALGLSAVERMSHRPYPPNGARELLLVLVCLLSGIAVRRCLSATSMLVWRTLVCAAALFYFWNYPAGIRVRPPAVMITINTGVSGAVCAVLVGALVISWLHTDRREVQLRWVLIASSGAPLPLVAGLVVDGAPSNLAGWSLLMTAAAILVELAWRYRPGSRIARSALLVNAALVAFILVTHWDVEGLSPAARSLWCASLLAALAAAFAALTQLRRYQPIPEARASAIPT